ncbi:hypothetical protein [Phormidesmis priestleyi]|uniref:hypothetical protein n=1 Tax=Phormidesmis priestleyi TaxID=268141 RepID=UPI00083B9B00|nr:hypothetical protein [Phormidesmis priestleyi]
MNNVWLGFADAKPSEAIQKHSLPGLAVAVVFILNQVEAVLPVPVKQYKDYKPGQKEKRALELAKWLIMQKQRGLFLTGFFHAHTQVAAATLGLNLIEELPRTYVQPHYNTYRLFFGDECIDFAQAIALMYYFLTINFGTLRAGMCLKPEDRNLHLLLDRFPGEGTKSAIQGQPIPLSQGAKFIQFIRRYSSTGLGIEVENSRANIRVEFANLDWWIEKDGDLPKEGKSHPHFVLPDWMAAAAIAHEFHNDFVATFKNLKHGNAAADGLEEVYNAFKSHDLWSLDENVLSLLRPQEKLWHVPDNAREFIMARAECSFA